MNTQVLAISIPGLLAALIPTLIVIVIMWRWSAGPKTALYATARMLIQLALIGYVLLQLFDTQHFAVVVGVLAVMLAAASWIAIRTVAERSAGLYRSALIAITVPGVLVLLLVSQVVIGVDPWFSPRYVIPLAGMIFAGAMNAVSLAAERVEAERGNGASWEQARRAAFQSSLIPIINSLFAVGLVTLPGMMTGQVLSGVSPLVAAKYQIVVMSMLFGVSGMSAAIFLALERPAAEK